MNSAVPTIWSTHHKAIFGGFFWWHLCAFSMVCICVVGRQTLHKYGIFFFGMELNLAENTFIVRVCCAAVKGTWVPSIKKWQKRKCQFRVELLLHMEKKWMHMHVCMFICIHWVHVWFSLQLPILCKYSLWAQIVKNSTTMSEISPISQFTTSYLLLVVPPLHPENLTPCRCLPHFIRQWHP